MARFLIRRLAVLVLGLFLASLLIFFTLRVLPGDVAILIAGMDASQERIDALYREFGLDQSLLTQYSDWMVAALQFDFGRSAIDSSSISHEIAGKLEVTLPLALLSLVIGLLIALPLGVYSAVRHNRASGAAASMGAQAFASVPAIWLGLVFIAIFAGWLSILPSQGFPRDGWAEPTAALRALLLPALTIGVIEGAMMLRFVRSAVLEALSLDYVRAGAARGLTKLQSLLSHGLPNVGLSLISVLGLQIAGILAGAVVVEQLFNLPGLGRMLITDVGNRDIFKVQSLLLITTAFVLVIGTLVDVLHRTIDPRQRDAR